MILIDNCQIYLSKMILECMKTTNKVFAFLLQYTPSLFSIELLFLKWKYLLSKSPVDKIANWRLMVGNKLIGDVLHKITTKK